MKRPVKLNSDLLPRIVRRNNDVIAMSLLLDDARAILAANAENFGGREPRAARAKVFDAEADLRKDAACVLVPSFLQEDQLVPKSFQGRDFFPD